MVGVPGPGLRIKRRFIPSDKKKNENHFSVMCETDVCFLWGGMCYDLIGIIQLLQVITLLYTLHNL